MSNAQGTVLRERQRFWRERMQACKGSGKTIGKCAAEHDLAAQAMYAAKQGSSRPS
jgi:hypothetical protein